MVTKIIAQNEEIVIGVDVSTIKHNVCVVSRKDGRVLRHEILLPAAALWRQLLDRLPGCDVTIVYEAGPDGYNLYDLIRAMGRQAVVVAPEKHLGYKTDKRDAEHIAHDFLAGRSRQVTVPAFEHRVDRQVLRTRNQLQKHRCQIGNQKASLARFHGLMAPGLPTVHKDRRGMLDLVMGILNEAQDFLTQKIKELEALLKWLMDQEEYCDVARALLALPGIGPVGVWHLTLNVADLGAFPSAGHFTSYLGLCPGEGSTGVTRRQGHITRRGPGQVRAVLVQCAWAAVRCDEDTRQRYQTLCARRGKKRAIIAIARRLAQKVWRVAGQVRRDAGPAACGACGPAPA